MSAGPPTRCPNSREQSRPDEKQLLNRFVLFGNDYLLWPSATRPAVTL